MPRRSRAGRRRGSRRHRDAGARRVSPRRSRPQAGTGTGSSDVGGSRARQTRAGSAGATRGRLARPLAPPRRGPSAGRWRSPEGALQPPQEPVVVSVWVRAELVLETQDLGTLPSGEPARDADVDPDQEVSAPARLERGHSATANCMDRAGLRAGGSSISSGPCGVGTEIVVPSAASVIVTDARTRRSSPSRCTPSSGLTWTLT